MVLTLLIPGSTDAVSKPIPTICRSFTNILALFSERPVKMRINHRTLGAWVTKIIRKIHQGNLGFLHFR